MVSTASVPSSGGMANEASLTGPATSRSGAFWKFLAGIVPPAWPPALP